MQQTLNTGELGDLAHNGAFAVLDALADGVYVTDKDRRIVYWNRAAERITGWKCGDVMGKSCRDNLLVHVDKDGHGLCDSEHCPLYRAMATGVPGESPLLVFARRCYGGRVAVEVTVAPLRGSSGEVIGGVEVFRDLTPLMDDLWRAKLIQDRALSSPLPPDPRISVRVRYTPQEIVGGDFYHIERLDSDRYAIFAADVMGHGVAAALYCMQLRALWEEYRVSLIEPARFVTQIARRLHGQVAHDGYYVTATHLLLDAATGDLACVLAGHPAPFLIGRDGSARPVGASNPALGLFPEPHYGIAEDVLEPGETLFVYTDGATEVMDAEGSELGPAGLLRIVREVQEKTGGVDPGMVEEQILRWSGAVRLQDDLTLISLTRAEG